MESCVFMIKFDKTLPPLLSQRIFTGFCKLRIFFIYSLAEKNNKLKFCTFLTVSKPMLHATLISANNIEHKPPYCHHYKHHKLKRLQTTCLISETLPKTHKVYQ